jgi:repressor LexA
MIDPTETQSKVLAFITEKIQEGIPPSLMEISSAFGWRTHAAAANHILALEKKGFIKRRPGHRGLTILPRVAA